MKKILAVAICFMLFGFACTLEPTKIEVKEVKVQIDSLKLVSFADTIVCDMVVKNPDTSDLWTDSCLRDFHRTEFIEDVFADIYGGKLLAIDYFSQKPLSIREVRKIEETSGYERGIIGKFQFREAWYYDKQNHTFIKKVYSIIFGYETYDDRGFVKGYKPLFKVNF